MPTLQEMFEEAFAGDPPESQIDQMRRTAISNILDAIKREELETTVVRAILFLTCERTWHIPLGFAAALAEWLKETCYDDPNTLKVIAHCMGTHPIAKWALHELENFE